MAGVDIGAATAKAVILRNSNVFSFSIIPTGHNVSQAADSVLRKVFDNTALSFHDVEYVVATGYGRRAVSFANKTATEIICHAAGATSVFPKTRTIIDIGGQDSKVIGVDDKSGVNNFVMNDKCAAGTGRFLEVMAKVLEVEIDKMGSISLKSNNPCTISSTCTVFAESEMVSLRAEGRSREDLIAGIHKAMAHRVVIMGKSVGFKKDIVFTGGVAKNSGMKKMLENEIKSEIFVPEEPQIMGALGAAILARAQIQNLDNVT